MLHVVDAGLAGDARTSSAFCFSEVLVGVYVIS